MVPATRHGTRLCHALLGLAVGVAVIGCKPPSTTAWARQSRVCEASGPPRLCLRAEPDQPIELRLPGDALVPGECATWNGQGPEVTVEIAVLDGAGNEHRERVTVERGQQVDLLVRPGLEIEQSPRSCTRAAKADPT